MNFDEEGKFREVIESNLDELVKEFAKERKISVERIYSKKNELFEKAAKYVNENKIELSK